MITHKRACELIDYDPDSGILTSKKGRGRVKRGDILGSAGPNGYIRLMVDGKKYLAHRLAWLIQTGEWPDGEIDHINRDSSDNRFCNLRDVSHIKNNQNKGCHSKYGVGVKRCRWRYSGRILVGQNRVHLGCYTSPEMASRAYRIASSLLDQGLFPDVHAVQSFMPAGWDAPCNAPRETFASSRRSPYGIGVKASGDKFSARISLNGKRYELGSYPEPQQASRAYETACQLIKLGIEPDRDRVKRYMKEIK